jgi:hypothetical protein
MIFKIGNIGFGCIATNNWKKLSRSGNRGSSWDRSWSWSWNPYYGEKYSCGWSWSWGINKRGWRKIHSKSRSQSSKE